MAAWCTVTDVRNVFPLIIGDDDYPVATVARYVHRAMKRMRSWLGGYAWGFTRSQMDGWETTKPDPVRDMCAELAAAFIQIDKLGLQIPNPKVRKAAELATCQLTYLRIYDDCRDLVAGRKSVEDSESNLIYPQARIRMNKSSDDFVFVGNTDI